MAAAGNGSVAQDTRLLIDIPIGKAHVECLKLYYSQNFPDSLLHDEWKRVLSTSLNTLEVKHPFSPHDLDVAFHEANCLTRRIIEFSSCRPSQRSPIESAMHNTLVPARRAKEKSRGIHSVPTVSKMVYMKINVRYIGIFVLIRFRAIYLLPRKVCLMLLIKTKNLNQKPAYAILDVLEVWKT